MLGGRISLLSWERRRESDKTWIGMLFPGMLRQRVRYAVNYSPFLETTAARNIVVFYGERLFVCLVFTVISLPPSGLLRDLHQGWVDCAAAGRRFQLVLLLHFLDTTFFFPFLSTNRRTCLGK